MRAPGVRRMRQEDSQMKTIIRSFAVSAVLLGVGAATFAAPAFARAKKVEEAKGPKLTDAVRKQLLEVQTKQTAGDNAGALAALRVAEQVPNRTTDDNYYIANLKIGIGQATKDNALVKEGLEGALATGQVPADKQVTFNRALGDIAVNAKDYATATRYYQAVLQAKPGDTEVANNLARLAFDNRALSAQARIAAIKNATDMSEQQNHKAEEFLYQARLQVAFDAKLQSEIEPAAKALIAAYPTPKNWESAIYAFRGGRKMDEQTDIDVYRLQRAAGAMTGEGQFLDYAQAAQIRGLPAESRAVLNEGVAKKLVDPTRPNYLELSRLVSPAKIAADRASLAGLEQRSRAAPNGKLADATADGYLSHGVYAKAAELYRLALSKGGVDAARTNTRLGIALAMSGDKAGADAAFKAVSGEPRAGLASYWMIWVNQKA